MTFNPWSWPLTPDHDLYFSLPYHYIITLCFLYMKLYIDTNNRLRIVHVCLKRWNPSKLNSLGTDIMFGLEGIPVKIWDHKAYSVQRWFWHKESPTSHIQYRGDFGIKRVQFRGTSLYYHLLKNLFNIEGKTHTSWTL